MMKRIVLIILLLMLIHGRLSAQTAIEFHFQKGNEFYLDEKYADAIGEYEAVISNGYASAELYYNLGNAYYKSGRLGMAILNYERALKLRPKDANIRFNLQLANLRVKDRIDMPPEFFLFRWNRKLVQLMSVRGWAWLFTGFFLLGSLLIAVRFVLQFERLRRLCKTALLSVFITAGLILIPLIQGIQLERSQAYGIIIQNSAKSLAAPQEGSTELFIVHEGTKVQVLDRDDGWTKIELIDGKQGWIPTTDLELI